MLGKHVASRPLLLGDAGTLADLDVAAVLGIAPLATYPELARWLGACMERPAAKKTFGALMS